MSNRPPFVPPPRPAPLAERLSAKQTALNTPVPCKECGSVYFYEVQANQYAGGGIGTVEFRRISVAPITLRICVCGEALAPSPQANSFGGRAGAEINAFYESVKLASEYRAKKDPSGIVQIAASKRELDAVKEDLEAALKIVNEKLKVLEDAHPKLAVSEDRRSGGRPPIGGVPDFTAPTAAPVVSSKGTTRGRKAKTPVKETPLVTE